MAVVAILAVSAVVGATYMSPTIHGAANANGRCRALVAEIGAATAVVLAGAIVATAWWNVTRTIDAVAVGAMVGGGSS